MTTSRSPLTESFPEVAYGGIQDQDNNVTPKHTGGSTTLQTIWNSVNTLMGVGILALPFAVKQCGWIGLAGLVFCAASTLYTAKTLGRNADTDPNIESYGEIGTAAFGKIGTAVVGGLFYCEIFAALVMYLSLGGNALHDFVRTFNSSTEYFSVYTCTFIISAIIYPTVLVGRLAWLSRLSFMGLITTSFLIVAIIYDGLRQRDEGLIKTAGSEHALFHPHTASLGIGLFMVGFVAHPVFPTIYRDMRTPKDYSRMLNIVYLVVGAYYLAVASLGYWLWGDGVARSVTINVQHGWVGRVNTLLILFLPVTKFALTLEPIAQDINKKLVQCAGLTKYQPTRIYTLGVATRTALWALTMFVAASLPQFAAVANFAGSLFSYTTCLTFPCLCYLKLYHSKAGWMEKVLNWLLVLIGVSAAIAGSVATLTVSPRGN